MSFLSCYETIHQNLQVINNIFQKLFFHEKNHCISDLIERTYSTLRRHDCRTSNVRFFDYCGTSISGFEGTLSQDGVGFF